MNTFRQSAHRISYYNAGGTTIAADAVVALANLIGIVVADILTLKTGILEIDGIHELPAKPGESWAQGVQLYWDDTNDYLVDAADTHPHAGRAATAKVVGATVCEVILNNND